LSVDEDLFSYPTSGCLAIVSGCLVTRLGRYADMIVGMRLPPHETWNASVRTKCSLRISTSLSLTIIESSLSACLRGYTHTISRESFTPNKTLTTSGWIHWHLLPPFPEVAELKFGGGVTVSCTRERRVRAPRGRRDHLRPLPRKGPADPSRRRGSACRALRARRALAPHPLPVAAQSAQPVRPPGPATRRAVAHAASHRARLPSAPAR